MAAIEIKAPDLPESVADATVARWAKGVGEAVKRDEVLAEIETDKVILEVVAPADGVISAILAPEGAHISARQLIAQFSAGAAPSEAAATSVGQSEPLTSPSVRRLLSEHELAPSEIIGSGKNGRITKKDVEAALTPKVEPAPLVETKAVETKVEVAPKTALAGGSRQERREPMSRLRQRIAERLLEAKNNTAMLTTFNEVNMAPIMELRQRYGEEFAARHGVKLSINAFFVKALAEALRDYPAINAAIDGNEVIYHDYFDLSVAVSTERGLVTPVLRNVETLSLAEIELGIQALANKARGGKLSVEDLSGGTFTLTNGGVFGSLLSTPIINPPQSAILGLHKIQDRPMAVNGQVVILPMMYVALSYDHRLVDGKESVGFLVRVKNLLEEPQRLLLSL